MATQDTCCSIAPYCKVHSGTFEAFGALCEQFVANTRAEPACLYQALKLEDLTRLEVHGPAGELTRLRDPLATLKPEFFTREYGFRRG